MFIEWSEVGKYHIENKKSNEDALISLKDGRNSAVALCDGVSTCVNSGEGARVACESLCKFFMYKGDKLAAYDRRTIAQKTVSHILYDLKKCADRTGSSLESLSSTAACAVYDDALKKIICINIGDALIGGIGKDGFEVIIYPQRGNGGCYVTTTKGVDRVAEIAIVDANKYHSVFICSDGMWKQFFYKGCLSETAAECFSKEDYYRLISLLKKEKSYDDRSIVAMNIGNIERDTL